ncbi:BTAD domain-containing putative transcriptional regulator [Mycolicibacterium sp. BiH015]|uniref:BTAD domain-containing putative transcriptional regulator n=1 Tax=Mycolicibacterium sp. BiH015 TaxID=3018808 RepID=UPI0022E3AA66|nr:BTAD domain-containing putative transcriptional regulator [Mycolicibacterium sp. BiH015]MDA2889605.1 BTAD domain-containing putative transcriptional regulator [Mycolicibacterium sp. BiH015]
MELGVLGPLQVRQFGLPVAIPGAKPRAVLTMLGLHAGSVVAADTLVELLWGDEPPRTAAKALQTHISALRRALGDGFVLTMGSGWVVNAEVDATRYAEAAALGRAATSAGNAGEAVSRFDEALRLWRGTPELPDGRRGRSEKTRWTEDHAALVEDRADALLTSGRAAEIIGELEAAIADAPLRERRWGQLMLALYRAGRQGEALAAYQRVRLLLAEELGVDPGPDLRRLEGAIVAQDVSLELPAAHHHSVVTRAVTFLLTDIEGSTAAWERDADAMAAALARHDEIVEQVVTFRGGRLIKTRGEGDATFSVFDRPSGAAAAAIELQEAMGHEDWSPAEPVRIRIALHTGEVEFRDGDYFGRAVNRAARLRSLADGGQILCSGATAELVIDSLADDVVLDDLGTRQLKNLVRPERVFELRLGSADAVRPPTVDAPMERPAMPAVLAGSGPFVGRSGELELLLAGWQTTLDTGARAELIAGEPGVGKTRLAAEWSRRAYEQGAMVLYGRCDEDLGAPYQPFAEALRSVVPCVGSDRLRGQRGVEALLPLVPGLTDLLPEIASPTRADPDTERYALFDAVVALLGYVSAEAPIILVLDDLHWAAKPTLLLLRHLLRFGEHARVQIVGTYRSTDLDRSHPLAAMLADLNRDGTADRLQLGGLDQDDVTEYLAASGYDDEELARALASVTGGNPFFLIEALRHVDESGGRWDPSTLPQGVREAVTRRLSRLSVETNKALGAAAVVGSRFAIDLVEMVVEADLVDAFDEARKAGIVIEEPGGLYRFNHALVRQSLLAELASVRRMRLHQRIATALETESGSRDELLAELAYHYFECAWAGNAAKAVDYCRRAADQAMARLAYEGAADLYDKALHALEEIDDELPDRDEVQAELLIARCEALLAAGDVAAATGAVAQLRSVAGDSGRLSAWGTCFDGQLTVLVQSERLDEIESSVSAAAAEFAALDDAAGEAMAHTVRAGCLGRLGRIGDCETALDQALTAARRAREHRRVNAVLANAPLAALWGPNSVPRAGGRCLDVVRLLRITTGSPMVEATSTRCQGVLDAFRGRAGAGRQLIESARRSLVELGMRHALLEVEQFAGIVELIADDPVAAEEHLRRAYNGFRRMRLDADTAETAALLARACLALERYSEADELCTESERLAGHALKASIAWRTVRAQLLARDGAHREARRVAEEGVAIAERTDALVDHGDACLALAVVHEVGGDQTRARAAAERAAELYELKGAAALVAKARMLIETEVPKAAPDAERTDPEPANACSKVLRRLDAAVAREDWIDAERELASIVSVESRRKIIGFPQRGLSAYEWVVEAQRLRASGAVRHSPVIVAVAGERLALTRLDLGTADETPGAPQDQAYALFALDNDGRIALQVWFEIEDREAAFAEMHALAASPAIPTQGEGDKSSDLGAGPQGNEASRVYKSLLGEFKVGNWDAMVETLAESVTHDDRRSVVNGGVQRGRDAVLANMRAVAELGVTDCESSVVATRGDRLALGRYHVSGGRGAEAFGTSVLIVAEVDAEGRLAAGVAFDSDDLDAAFEELDARYLAGEAARYAETWVAFAGAYAAFNRGELYATTADETSFDHRRGAAFAPGELNAYLQAAWEDSPGTGIRAETVHRLTDRGVVVTHLATGMSRDGFDAEWRDIAILMVEGGRISRTELFDTDDLDRALARFEQLNRPASRAQNAASRIHDRFLACFADLQWQNMNDLLADDVSQDDRRRAVNGGIIRGRDAFIGELRSLADYGLTVITATTVATRGERLALSRAKASVSDERTDGFSVEIVDVVEVDADHRLVARTVFDVEDLDAAFAELEARYVAGEASQYADTWWRMVEGCARLNRHEAPLTTADFVDADHRSGANHAPGDMMAFVSESWGDTPDLRMRMEAVHALADSAAVVTTVLTGTSTQGFEAEWRSISVVEFDGPLSARTELFDEADLDAALGVFGEITKSSGRLANSATCAADNVRAAFARGDWDAIEKLFSAAVIGEDRRDVIGGNRLVGVLAELMNLRTLAALGAARIDSTTLAIRGDALSLHRAGVSDGEKSAEVVFLTLFEVDADGRITADISFDEDDFGAAVKELDARYVASLPEPYARAYSAIARGFAEISHGRIPALAADFADADHRTVAGFEPGGLTDYLRVGFSDMVHSRMYIESVHRVSGTGAVFTHVAKGASRDGLIAEWRVIDVVTLEGDLFSRCELFDDSDVSAALARFDELQKASTTLANTATRVCGQFRAAYAARDFDALAAMLADDLYNEDRRSVVNAGIRHGRGPAMQDLREAAETAVPFFAATEIATRGDRLVLVRGATPFENDPEAFRIDSLQLAEINDYEQISAIVMFDVDDVDAAIEELDARYLAGEAASHARTWSAIIDASTAFNRHELPPTTPDWVSIDHRSVIDFAPGEMTQYMRATVDVARHVKHRIVTVHRLADSGAVFTQATSSTSSSQGFDAEWREVIILRVKDDMISRCEIFDESGTAAALARFAELGAESVPWFNAATRMNGRLTAAFDSRDIHGYLEACSADAVFDDRRKGMHYRGPIDAEFAQALLFTGAESWRLEIETLAVRGDNLMLGRYLFRDTADADRPAAIETLLVLEVDTDELVKLAVVFDHDNLDAALAELDARYLAGEAGGGLRCGG